MISFTLCRYMLIATAIIVLTPISECSAQDAKDNKREIKLLQENWARQEREIFNAHIKLKMLRRGSSDLAIRTRDDLVGALKSADLTSEKGVKDFALTVVGNARATPELMATCEYFYDGSRKIEIVDGGGRQIHYRDGDKDILFSSANKMAQIRHRTDRSQYLMPLEDLRTVPSARLATASERVDVQGSSLEILSATHRVVADRSSGTVLEYESFNGGQTERLIIHSGLVSHAGDIVFPNTTVMALFDGVGKLNLLSVAYITDAQFNYDLPADSFSVPASPGDTILDHRKGERPAVFTSSSGSKDILQHIGSADVIQAVNTKDNQLSIRVFLIVLASFLLILFLGHQLWRVRSRAKRPPIK